MKRCSKCKNEYPATLEYFSKASKYKDGLRCECKQCCKDSYNNPIGKKLICQYCGCSYSPKSKERDKYCRRECYFLSIEKKCVTCGETLKGKKRKYCSDSCRPKQYYVCVVCGKKEEGSPDKVYCSDECRKENARIKARQREAKQHLPETFKCKECGKAHTTKYGEKVKVFCSDECRKKYGRRVAKATRKAKMRGCKDWRSVDPLSILARDGWQCQICGIKTPKKYRGTIKDNAPEVDHIVPLALGGSHSEDNLQCLCRKCNQDKGATVYGQMRIC